uniref:PEP-CTERM motif protein n=1 Tax=uncultured bacterium CSL132 TaxID=1091568 RepID=G4WVK7_9BACT|nr:PEP-CTERM motif protein [uncultured bacterium CSL132]
MHAKSWFQIGSTAAIFALAEAAFALPLTLTGPVANNSVGPQSASAPCVIAATQCSQPAGFGFNNFTASGGDSAYNMYSTTPTANVADGVQGTPYLVSQIETVVGSVFQIAIDVNTTNAAGETLQLFEVIINNVVAYNYIGPTPIGVIVNNGNGYADWTLGVVDLSSYANNATVLFHAVWDHASDGGESFFLIAGSLPPTQIPEPTTLPLLAIAMLGLGAMRRRRTV